MSSNTIFITSGESLSSFSFNPTTTTTNPLTLKTTNKSENTINFLTSNSNGILTLSRSGCTVYETKNGHVEELYQLKRTDEDRRLPINSAILLLDSKIIISSGINVYSYCINSSVPPNLLCSHTASLSTSPSKAVTSFSLNTDSTLLVSTYNSACILHNLTTSHNHSLNAKPKSNFSSTLFHPTRRTFLAAATTTGLLHLFDVSKPSAPIRTFNLSPNSSLPSPIVSLSFSTSLLVTASSIGTVHLIDFEKMKELTKVELQVQIKCGGISLSGDGRHIVFVLRSNKIGIMDLKLRNGIKEVAVPDTNGSRVENVCFQIMPKNQLPKSPTKHSAVLTESLNKARLEKALLKGKVESLREEELVPSPSEVFSPLQFNANKRSATGDGDSTLPPSKTAFAESIRREAQTSTLRPLTLRTSLASALTSQSPPSTSTNTFNPRPSSSQSKRTPSETPRPSSSSTTLENRNPPRSHSSQSYSRSESPNLPSFFLSKNTPGPNFKGLRSSFEEEEEDNNVEAVGERNERTPLASVGSNDHRRVASEQVNKSEKSSFAVQNERKEKKVGFRSVEKEKENGKILPTSVLKYSKHQQNIRYENENEVEDDDEVLEQEQERSLVLSERGRGSKGVTRLQSGGNEMLKETVREIMEEFQVKSDIQNLHMELIKQSHVQKIQMRTLLSTYLGKELEELRSENKLLKEENARLRRGY